MERDEPIQNTPLEPEDIAVIARTDLGAGYISLKGILPQDMYARVMKCFLSYTTTVAALEFTPFNEFESSSELAENHQNSFSDPEDLGKLLIEMQKEFPTTDRVLFNNASGEIIGLDEDGIVTHREKYSLC